MNTPLRFIIADNNTSGILTTHDNLIKDFSAQLRYVHNIDQLGEEVGRNEATILFYDLDFLDTKNAINVLSEIRFQVPRLTILPIVSRKNTSLIRELVALQLFFYITAPLDYKDIKVTIRRALETISLAKKETKREPAKSVTKEHVFHGMTGQSASMQRLFNVIEKISEDDYSTVLIRGESGTGKEMIAKAIHQCSPRSKFNFVPVNCAAIPDELLESELFGYTKGAFTGANTNKPGRIQFADKGTLFLDEIGDMKPSLQAKLLRVLQEREFEPVGGFKTTSVDTRVLAATHCNLEKLVKEGLFREDLYYRLSVIPIEIPPLRERKDDIPLLIQKFITNYTTKRARPSFSFAPDAMESLLHYNWQGNVRELENLIQHMSVLYSGTIITRTDLPAKYSLVNDSTQQNLDNEREALWSFSEPKRVAEKPTQEILPVIEDSSLFFNQEQVAPITGLTDFDIDSTRPNFGDFAENISASEQPYEENLDTIEFPRIHWEEEGINFKELVCSFENQLIIKALQKSLGNKKAAANLLGLKRTTLLEKIKKKGLQDCWKLEEA